MSATVEELRLRLRQIAEELADLAHRSLRNTLETGGVNALAEERLLTRARRSVLKAVAILGNSEGGAEEEGTGP
ncbi:MAG TPA: hypothetical protein VK425_05750 [Acidimicrobiales bacterium]|nr:hypothetical protein [Acidimicrobiales bacterium]